MIRIDAVRVGVTLANCYLVAEEDSSEGVLVDPGAEPGRIMKKVHDSGLTITHVLNTHCHFDHMGANAEILAETGAKLAIHPADQALLEMRGGAEQFGLPASESPPPDLLLEHGQRLAMAGLEFEVLHTPGHSPGSVSFYAADERVVFTGDVIFAGGIGRADLWRGDEARLLASIRDVLMELPPDTHVYPGHGPMTTIGEEMRTNPYLQ